MKYKQGKWCWTAVCMVLLQQGSTHSTTAAGFNTLADYLESFIAFLCLRIAFLAYFTTCKYVSSQKNSNVCTHWVEPLCHCTQYVWPIVQSTLRSCPETFLQLSFFLGSSPTHVEHQKQRLVALLSVCHQEIPTFYEIYTNKNKFTNNTKYVYIEEACIKVFLALFNTWL